MRKGALLACMGVALLQAGCNTLDSIYIREGIGTNLSSPELVEVTNVQELYVGEICRQAGLRIKYRGEEIYCDEVNLRSSEWATFVQAGMNDIDRRCDAYLAWLDNKRRWREPVLKQLATTAATTAAIMGLTGASATSIAIAAAAFGFAQETFVNYNSRLITEIDQSVIQSVVLDNQNQFRVRIVNEAINNRPAAIYLLRNYLRICMPFSIEMSINTTIATYHRSGIEGLAQRPPILIRPPAVQRQTAMLPVAPRDTLRPPQRDPAPPTKASYAEIFDLYVPTKHTTAYVVQLQQALCMSDLAEMGSPGPNTKALIKIYKMTERQSGEKLSDDDATRIREQVGCQAGGGRNYFEKRTYDDPVDGPAALKQLIDGLNKIPNGPTLPAGTSLIGARGKIRDVRKAQSAQLKLDLPVSMRDQVTPDLLAILPRQ